MSTEFRKLTCRAISTALLVFIAAFMLQCASTKGSAEAENFDTLVTNRGSAGTSLRFEFTKGSAHNHPLMAIWLEDTDGNYIETLYVAESIGTGVFRHGQPDKGKWQPGPVRRPAALPHWGHQRGVTASDGLYLPGQESPVPDAITGPTPPDNFILLTHASRKMDGPFVVKMEINQSWDWNEYWTNNKYPDDPEYKTSSQPAVIYAATIDPQTRDEAVLEPIGHSHYSGKDGKIYQELETLTTALQITERVKVEILSRD